MKRILMTCLMTVLVGYGVSCFAQSITPSDASVVSSNPTTNVVLDNPAVSPDLQEAHNWEAKTYQAIQHQTWLSANRNFKEFEKASQNVHHPLTAQQYYDWARVAYWAGDLSEAQKAYEKANHGSPIILKNQLDVFHTDLINAQQDPHAYRRRLQAIGDGTFGVNVNTGQSWMSDLMIALAFLAIGGALTIIVLKRYGEHLSRRGHYNFDSSRVFGKR